jgi:hypothetical protein
MRLTAIAVLASGLALASPVMAQDVEQLGLARDVLVSMKAADNFDAVVPSLMTALKPALTAGNAKAAKDFDEIMPMITNELSTSKNMLIDQAAMIYAKAFTKPELSEMAAFYKTPTGQKMARLTPVLTQQMMAAGQQYAQQMAGQLTTRIQDELKKRGNKL